MLHASQLPEFLWGEAVKHAIYLKNRTSTKALDNKTPFKVFYGVKPNLRGLPEFRCRVFVHSPGGSKLDVQAVEGKWVGFDEESSGHRVYHPQKQNISIERSVKFDPTETEIYLPHNAPLEGENDHTIKKIDEQAIVDDQQGHPDPLGENFEQIPQMEGRPKCVRMESAAIQRLRAGEGVISDLPRERGLLPKGIQEGDTAQVAIDDAETGVMAAITVVSAEEDELEPLYEQACRRSDWPQWKQAIGVELENLKAAGTWEIVERPEGVNVVDSKMGFQDEKGC